MEVSHDQYKVQYLLNRISEITRAHEDELATGSLQLKILTQERDELQNQVQRLESELAQLNERVSEWSNGIKEEPVEGQVLDTVAGI